MQRHFPALARLQGLFSYNPLTGEITNLQDRGPKKAGSSAISRPDGRAKVFVDGKLYRAADIAYILAGGQEAWDEITSGLYACCANRDLDDFTIENLYLDNKQQTAREIKAKPKRLTSAKRAINAGIKRRQGKWEVTVQKAYLGRFATKEEALAAKFAFLGVEPQPKSQSAD
jgi:hypothetical protein